MNKYAYVFVALAKTGMSKAEALGLFTEGKASRLSELTPIQVANFAKWLGAQDPSLPKTTAAPELRAKRAKVLAAFSKAMGWPENLKFEARHWDALNGWLAHRGAVKERFHRLDAADLARIIAQLGAMLENNEKSAFSKMVKELIAENDAQILE